MRHRFKAMGGPCTVVLDLGPAPGAAAVAAAAAAVAAAEAEVRRIEQAFSRYRSDSVVARINAAAGSGRLVAVDDETAGLLAFAGQLHAASAGLFDITSGVLGRAWDFRAAKPRLPGDAELAALLPLVGWSQVDWQPEARLIGLPRPGMALDFGGFGKEYAADRAAAMLQRMGQQHGHVNLAGDIRVLGPQADGQPWRLAVQHPRDGQRQIASLALHTGAMATSGDYERYFEIDGRRYCHILDPRSGWPVAHWQSVSVVAPVCAAAGALCTLAMLMGAPGLPWLRAQGGRCLLVGPDGALHDEAGAVMTGHNLAPEPSEQD